MSGVADGRSIALNAYAFAAEPEPEPEPEPGHERRDAAVLLLEGFYHSQLLVWWEHEPPAEEVEPNPHPSPSPSPSPNPNP